MTTPLSRERMGVGSRWRNNFDGELHAAADYSVPIHTPVFAVRDGTVLDCNDGEENFPADGLEHGKGEDGNWILLGITYKDRPTSVLYLHLSPGLLVEKGKTVTAGKQIAESGNSGHTFNPHLHVAAMFGHRSGADRFAYLSGIPSSDPPPRGVASNGITIYPPGQIYGRPLPGPFDQGVVHLHRLRFGVEDSNSVRRLQTRLNRVRLVGGTELPVTGRYGEMTRDEVSKWQVQKDGKTPGSALADGNLRRAQARKLFPSQYTIKP